MDPTDAPWPYTDADKGEPLPAGSLSYVPPASGAGRAETFESIDGTPAGQGLGVTNCRSHMEVIFWRWPDGRTEKEVLTDQIDPEDRVAFERFADEVIPAVGP